MNKFHKTAYGRPNFNAISSSHGKRNPYYHNQPEMVNLYSKEDPLERKVDIESSLLLTHKNYQRMQNRPT